ncbi:MULTISPECIES: hypothetical protein [Bacillus]|uniref:hypothetical protein n=1 Tax=Bacillus TaxID=1386 RepID=UPI000BB94DFA|nr:MULTISPECIES: hypothetical protein [Bacillus]
MKKFFLLFFLTIVILLAFILGVSTYFEYRFSNVAFITSIIACFITYGGGATNFGEANVAINTNGAYVPSNTEKVMSSLNPFFIASCITLIACLASYPFFI